MFNPIKDIYTCMNEEDELIHYYEKILRENNRRPAQKTK
jgi:hypothetical protein